MQHSTRIAMTFALAPLAQLLGEIGCRLPGERRVALSHSSAFRTVARTACRYVAGFVAQMVKAGCRGISLGGTTSADGRPFPHRRRKFGVVIGHAEPGVIVEPLGYPTHLRVSPLTAFISFELAQNVPRILAGKARRQVAVSLPVQSMAGYAGTLGARISAAQRNQFTGLLERSGDGRGFRAAAKRGGGENDRCRYAGGHKGSHCERKRLRPPRGSRTAAIAVLALAACKPPQDTRYSFDVAAIERGRQAIERTGCAACHTIPGIAWPRGRTAPPLTGFDDVGMIAGLVPNTPENLAAFLRDPQSVKPSSTMPAMPLTPSEARDVASYLYGIDDD